MKASKLLRFLNDLQASGVDLTIVDVLYRYDSDSDEVSVYHVSEDLYDEETNSIPISIMLSTGDINC
jgi:hypothetical protein